MTREVSASRAAAKIHLRRRFLTYSGQGILATALAGLCLPRVHAARPAKARRQPSSSAGV
jgi:hypothetical protein